MVKKALTKGAKTDKSSLTPKIFCAWQRLAEAGDLKPHPDNAHRSHPEKQLDRYEAVIRGNGWRKPVVVSKRSGFIVKGHGAWLMAKRAGWMIPVEDQDYASLAEERRDLIADNRLALGAVNDEQKLAQLLSEMDAPDVELMGLSGYELEQLIEVLKTGAGNDPNAEWQGMPEFQQDDIRGTALECTVRFLSVEARAAFEKFLGWKLSHKGKLYSTWYPKPSFDQLGTQSGSTYVES